MSANGEDTAVFDAFFSSPEYMNKDHFYMEIGGHDGIWESNSRLYDVCLGWKGLLVEPHPKSYERMVQLRPSAHHLGIAPSCAKNSTGIVKFSDHLYTSAQVGAGDLEIHCGPLQHYLNALSIKKIDFFSLDVEVSTKFQMQIVGLPSLPSEYIFIHISWLCAACNREKSLMYSRPLILAKHRLM